MNDKLKMPLMSFFKGLIPLVTTLVGALLGSLCGAESAGSTLGAVVGVLSTKNV